MRADRRRRLVADRLAAVRHQAGMTVGEIAQRARCHPNDVHRYERGDQPPPVSYVIVVADTFTVSCDYLLGRSDQPRPLVTIPPGAVPVQLLRDAVTLTHPDRHPPARRELATSVTQRFNALIDQARDA
jgi:transcriptional regulator with XRE-family HTH domain